MLVITRKADEGIIIGENIKVTVIDLSKDRAKLGIEAPSDVKIIRSELYQTEKFNVQAATNKMPTNLVNMLLAGKTPEPTAESKGQK